MRIVPAPRHGYAIATDHTIAPRTRPRQIYPLLHRLRRLGYVTTEWRTPPEGRRRQYYMLTDGGRAALADQQRQWLAVTRALNDVWPGSGGLLTALGEA